VVRLQIPPGTANLQTFLLPGKARIRVVAKSRPLGPDEVLHASRHWADWLALPLCLPAGAYLVYVLASIVGGSPALRPELLGWGALAGAALAGWIAFGKLRTQYWRLDARGLTRGRITPLHIPWSEIEGVVLGLFTTESPLWRVAASLDDGIAAQRRQQLQLRAGALVLRLSGGRLFMLLPLKYSAQLQLRFLDAVAELIAGPGTLTPVETRALARWDGEVTRVG